MFRLALATLRFRLGASFVTFVAVLLGCGILVVCGGIFETAFRLNAAPSRLSAAGVVVAGSGGYRLGDTPEVIPYSERAKVSEDMRTKIAGIPGVERVVADRSFSTVLADDPEYTAAGLYGHGWQSTLLTPYHLQSGHEPAKNEVAINTLLAHKARLKQGDLVSLMVSGERKQYKIAGIVQASHAVNAPAFFFTDAEAAGAAMQSGKVDALGVLTRPGSDITKVAGDIRRALPATVSVWTGDDRGMAEYSGVAGSRLPLLLLGGVFSGMLLVVMILVISATIGLSVRQRQQELALLRANGATPKQVRRMVVIETMLVAVVAIALGAWLGDAASSRLFASLADHGLISAALTFQHGLIPIGGAVVIATLLTWITAKIAAGAAARTQPIQAMTEAAVPAVAVSPVRRWLAAIFAIATLGLAGATMFMDPETASAVGGPAVLTGSIAVGLCASELLHRLVGVLQRPAVRLGGGLGLLALKNVRMRSAQFAGVVTPLTLAIAIALGNIYSQTTQQHASNNAYTKQFNADLVVKSEAGGFAADAVQTALRTEGVRTASRLVTSQGWLEKPYDKSHTSDPWRLIGIDVQKAGDVPLATPVSEGSLHNLTGSTVALPQKQAHALGVALGNSVQLRLGDGSQVSVKVVAITNGPADYASIIVPATLLAPHTSSGLASHMLVTTNNDTRAKEQLQNWPATEVGGRQLLADSIASSLNVQAWINYLIASLAVAYAAIAMVNALAVIVGSRRREFAMQRLVGATRRQILHMAAFESLIVSVIALGLGTVISIFTIVPMAVADGAVPYGPLWIFLVLILITLGIATVVAYLAARAASKQKPITALATE